MKYISTIFFFLCYLTGFPQDTTTEDVDSLATARALEILNSKRTSEVLIFNNGCVGCEVLNELCECFDGYSKTYLIWLEDNNTMVERIDCCLEFEIKQLKNNEIWQELQDNKNSIFNSEFNEDYFTSHFRFWYLELLPTIEGKHRIFDYYFDEGYEYKHHNSAQPSNLFKRRLVTTLRELGI